MPRSLRGQDVRLAYGERPDGVIVHISQVASGLACDCVCPGCNAHLVARKGRLKEHHFGHYRAVPCKQAFESALHKLAKQVLNYRRELLLPEVRAEIGDQELVTHKEEVHQFDDAVLEHHLDAIVPDVIVRKGNHQLLVEMYVTRRCGPEKIQRIMDLGLSCVEIDLRRIARDATHEQVADALLGQAGRYWIYNPKLAVAHERLTEKIAREAEEKRIAAERAIEAERRKLAALAEKVDRIIKRPVALKDHNTPAIIDVCAGGFGDHIGHSLRGDFAFTVPSREWQARIIQQFIIFALEQRPINYSFHTTAVFRAMEQQKLIRAGMPTYFNPEIEQQLQQQLPEFRSPYKTVEAFLFRLECDDVLRSSRKNWHIHEAIERRWEDRRRRRWELNSQENLIRGTLARILKAIPEEEQEGFSVDHWWRIPHPELAISFNDAFDQDDRRLTELSFVLYRIETMLFRGGKIVDDHFGLPLAAQCARIAEERERKAEAERRTEIEKQNRIRDDRVRRLKLSAREALGSEADGWLCSPLAPFDCSPEAMAAQSDDRYHVAQVQLRHAAQEQRSRQHQQALRARLMKLVDTTRRPAHARLFLTSPHPRWQNRHPIESCVDDASFEKLRQAMVEAAR